MTRPLRVALVFGSFPPIRNGGSDFLARFAPALAAAGAQVSVVTSWASAPEREAVAAGVTVHRIVESWGLGRAGRRSLRQADRLLEDEGIDVVHVFFPDSELGSELELMAALGAGRPLVTTFWNLGLGRRSPMRVRATAAALLARSRALTSHDPAYLSVLRRARIGRPVHWLPVGNNVHAAVGAPPDRDGSTLAYFGQVDFTRGLEDLFEALRRVRSKHDVRLVMIGSAAREERYAADQAAHSYLRRIRALPAELGVEDAVRWTGYLPDAEVAALLAGADLCVLPYRRNSLGRSSLAAALQLGAPTVLAGSEAAIAPLRAGRHVALVRRGDPAALAGEITRLLESPTERARLAAGARSAGRLFAWPRIASGALAVYRLVVLGP